MNIRNISFFKGPVTNLIPEKSQSLIEIIDAIKSEVYKIPCSIIRHSADKKIITDTKKKLDYITFGGKFSKRHITGLIGQSGWIVIDLDHVVGLADIKKILTADKYVAAVFISPSGQGLKVVFRINDADFKTAFVDISMYLQREYKLVIDASGSDITRACFMSYDPEAYINENHELYKIKDIKPESEAKQKKEIESYKNSDGAVHAPALERLERVVNAIVDKGIDITKDYSSQWLLIGFSMATYGEVGREFFHKISQLNEAYNADEVNKKFDDFIKNTRFTNPAKFFAIAKENGIDISNKKPEKADIGKTDTSIEKKKAEKEEREKYVRETVFYYKNPNRIIVSSGRTSKNIADLHIYVKYKTKDERDEITWVLEAKMDNDKSIFIEVSHEDFCSASKMKRAFASESISLRISDSELSELHGFLFTKTEFMTALKVVRFGWNAEAECYLFSNVVWHNGELLTPDNFGIIKAKNMYLSVPNPKSIMKKRHEITEQSVDINDFFKTYFTAHGYDLGFMPICFLMFSIFRDIGVHEKGFSPILYLKGGAGTGKSSMVRILTAMFGRKQEGVNLKNKNTEAALVKIMSQMSNGIIWFDEFHNEFPYEGILQAAYDNDGYHRSSDTNSIDTNSVDLFSALALTSNYLPDNPIFFSRCIFVPITNNQKTQEQRDAFYKLEAMQEGGLGCITLDLLAHRALIESYYKSIYKNLFDAFRDNFKGIAVAERLLTNMAQIMTVPFILNLYTTINISTVKKSGNDETDANNILKEFVSIGALVIERQHRIMNESKAIAEFWEIIQGLYETGYVLPGTHFWMHGQPGLREIKLNFPKLYNLFAPKYRQIFMKMPPDRDTIQTEMAVTNGNSSWEEISKAIRFLNDGEGNSQSKTTPVKGSAIISYEKIIKEFGVDFESRAMEKLY